MGGAGRERALQWSAAPSLYPLLPPRRGRPLRSTRRLLPCRVATVAGLPLTGLADRLALLASRAMRLEGRYPPITCLAPACTQLHALLGAEAAAGKLGWPQLCMPVVAAFTYRL